MTDTIFEASNNLFTHLMSAGVTDLIIYGIGFILFCILGSLLTRKDRKANPEKYARIAANMVTQDNPPVNNPMGTIVTANGIRTYTQVGNTTYLH